MKTKTTLHPYITGLQKEFEKHANPENAAGMKKYMRNQFEFFGITSPQRKNISKIYMQDAELPDKAELHKIVNELWELPQREFQYFALEFITKYKKQFEEKDIELFEKLVVTKSWWDTVDNIASHVIGVWMLQNPAHIKTITMGWNRSNNIWLQRMSLLFQLKYKKQTNLDLLEDYINELSESKEFFVKKAIGWILREYSKTDAEYVKKFVAGNRLSELSKREAMKVIERN